MESSEITPENKPDLHHKSRLRAMLTPRRVFLLLLMLFLFWLFFFAPLFEMIGWGWVNGVLSRVYTPPTLTKERVAVYAEFIRLVEKHHEYQWVQLDVWGRLITTCRGKVVYDPREPTRKFAYDPEESRGFEFDFRDTGVEPPVELMKRFPPAEIAALKALSLKIRKVHCVFAEMIDNKSGYLFKFEPSAPRGRPVSPVAVYMIDPPDPNDVSDARRWTGSATLVHIKGRWYASRQLRPSRDLSREPTIPGSWFDHSLNIPPNLDAESATLSSEMSRPTE